MENITFKHLIALIDDLSEQQRDHFRKALDGSNDLEKVISILENHSVLGVNAAIASLKT